MANMNQDQDSLQKPQFSDMQISLPDLKRSIRRAAKDAEGNPRGAMADLRVVFETLILDLYRTVKERLAESDRDKAKSRNIENSAAAMYRKLKDAGLFSVSGGGAGSEAGGSGETVAKAGQSSADTDDSSDLDRDRSTVETMADTLNQAGVFESAEVFNALQELNAALHVRLIKPTPAHTAKPLQTLLYFLRWIEAERQKSRASASPPRVPPAALNGPFNGRTIILASVSPDSEIEDEWRKLSQTLADDGVSIVIPGNNPAADSEFNEAAKKAELFILIHSTLDEPSRPEAQFEAFCRASGLERNSKRILMWRKKIADLSTLKLDEEIVQSLEDRGRKFCQEQQTGDFEQFIRQIRTRLAELASPTQTLLLNVMYDEKKDQKYADSLVAAISRLSNRVRWNEITKITMGQFKKALQWGEGCILLYGNTKRQFVRDGLTEYNRAIRRLEEEKRKFSVRPHAIFEAPPGEEAKEDDGRQIIPPHEWRLYGSRDKDRFQPGEVEKYYEELRTAVSREQTRA